MTQSVKTICALPATTTRYVPFQYAHTKHDSAFFAIFSFGLQASIFAATHVDAKNLADIKQKIVVGYAAAYICHHELSFVQL